MRAVKIGAFLPTWWDFRYSHELSRFVRFDLLIAC
jgi:hypothetical protein